MRETICTSLSDYVMSHAKTKVNKSDVDAAVSTISYALTAVNSMSEHQSMLFDMDVRAVEFPDWLSKFVLPKAVRFDVSSYLSEDLLIRSALNQGEVEPTEEDYFKFRNAVSFLESRMRVEPWNKKKSLEEVRKVVSLGDIVATVSVDGKVRLADRPFIPVPVARCVGNLYVEDVFIRKATLTMKDYFVREFSFEMS